MASRRRRPTPKGKEKKLQEALAAGDGLFWEIKGDRIYLFTEVEVLKRLAGASPARVRRADRAAEEILRTYDGLHKMIDHNNAEEAKR